MSDTAELSGRLPTSLLGITGAFACAASITSCVSIFLHFKNYRKPLLQRFVVRIQTLIPLYALTCWLNLVSHRLSMFLEPFRDVYEAFVLYQFLWLLTNFLGGERSVIVTMYGKPPRSHLFPFKNCLPKIDISDPHIFLAIKRGVLQYAWLKPVLAGLTFLMKAVGIYKEGYISWSSGYLWMGLIYNASVSLALYSLALFWVCLDQPLQPFRPVPKFLCIKLILFAAFWQGFILSLLVLLGFIHDVGYYTPNNVARVVQNSLMCVELLFFAIGHWYAFSWKDYVDDSIGSARMPISFAFRDAYGMADVAEDFKDTFQGQSYQYRAFDSAGAIEHPQSAARLARLREGLRYQRGGEAKYWLPPPSTRRSSSLVRGFFRFPDNVSSSTLPLNASPTTSASVSRIPVENSSSSDIDEDWALDESIENLYKQAKAMPFGDYNYPVVTVNESLTYTPLIKKFNQDNFDASSNPYSWIRRSGELGRPSSSSSTVSDPSSQQARAVQEFMVEPRRHSLPDLIEFSNDDDEESQSTNLLSDYNGFSAGGSSSIR
ncbi:organic solute transporter Ostalpha-domain-containing protein [Lipomyces japonicus]|uniref:organic solute transporter Ostalpha-domain-containing protein n=1 Tax=Lipomyces japonicus TaxID=56871 RepID=UPI0034CF5EAD